MIYLLRNAAGSSPGAAIPAGRDYARHWTPVHMDFVVDDFVDVDDDAHGYDFPPSIADAGNPNTLSKAHVNAIA